MLVRALMLVVALVATGCASTGLPKPKAELMFDEGQRVQVQMLGQNQALETAFMSWVDEGLYTNAPVYRQLPGVFVLAGKPRLSGQSYVQGPTPVAGVDRHGKRVEPELHEAGIGHIGLVVHADGSIGPEMILIYGGSPRACCDAPQNVRIGKISSGRFSLKDVKRGDNLVGVARTQ